MARLHPCGHNNSNLGGWICTKFCIHMLQTMSKDEFEFRGRSYFSDFSIIFFVQQRVANMAHLHPFGHNNSSLGGWICTKFCTHMLYTITKNEFEFGGCTYSFYFSRNFFVEQRVAKTARLHPCGHGYSSLGGYIFTKPGIHMLQTIVKYVFE